MGSVGMVRRMDDLGRIVIPKEIRKEMGLIEGTNLELYMDGNQIILKKCNTIAPVQNRIKELQAAIYESEYQLCEEDKNLVENQITALKEVFERL